MSGPAAIAERALWQAYAHLYDGLLDVYAYRDMLGEVARLAEPAGRTVLDAGCGTGNVAGRLVRDGAARVIAVDASSNMVGLARRKLAAEIGRRQVQVIHDDAVSLMASLPPASVDRITAVNFLYVLADRNRFFEQARRILRPGGYLLAAHTTRPGAGPIIREQWRRGGWPGLLRPRLAGIAVVDLVIDLLARGGRYDFAPVTRLREEAAAAGLGTTLSLGRTYGGPGDGVNELVKIC